MMEFADSAAQHPTSHAVLRHEEIRKWYGEHEDGVRRLMLGIGQARFMVMSEAGSDSAF